MMIVLFDSAVEPGKRVPTNLPSNQPTLFFPLVFSRKISQKTERDKRTGYCVMKAHLFSLLVLLFSYGQSKPDIHINYRFIIAVPTEYNESNIGRAFLMENTQAEPGFKAALSIEPVNGNYSCSLEVFLGDVKVWSSGHRSKFYLTEKCVLELTSDGDLQLKGPKERVGWRTGTSGQGVERLQILRTGNLVLLDALNRIKWQSFNFPTDVMLRGQRLNVATHLTSFPSHSSVLYSFEILRSKIALYLNSGKRNYSYWEFKPSKNRNISFIELGPKGLELFNDKHKKIAQIISSQTIQPLRFLALGNKTGNLGLYFYSPQDRRFGAAFQALNNTCDLPQACRPYGICTISNSCSCLQVLTKGDQCNAGIPEGFCGKDQVEMLELGGLTNVLKAIPEKVNSSKEACADLCLADCTCVAALYSSGEEDKNLGKCFIYGMVMGVKQIGEEAGGLTYMVKVPRGTKVSQGKSQVKKWVFLVVGVADGLIILVVLAGIGYYLIQRRRKNLTTTRNNS
ncbi:hypothetical protein K2173_000194 [Erythroxylum novogranatense]|uniref:Bulb-type lectin domain-containing protein n=1 Tax=Erythroxylum novogranatense TaxID=1862640 RepID=A0AAV8SNW6_9ROSI|nr:hypothetical protein K2173_000194 [Erythroxylum novogranatense]